MKGKQFLLYNLTTCNLLLVGGALALECRDGQKERKDNQGQPICCYTVKCNASQGFHLCRTNQGSDSCYNCDMDEFTTDMIDTADAMEEVSVCQKMPTCVKESEYLDKTNYRCYCDRSKGFYGEADNCMRSMDNCNYPGYELGNDGKCVVCGKDTFKSGSDNSICKQKTKCKDDEIETSSGSTTTDRTCSKTTSTTTPAPASSTIDDRNKDGSDTGMIVGVVVGLLILIAFVVVFCYCRTVKRKSFIEVCKKKKTKHDHGRISLYDFKSKEAEEPFLPNGDNGSHSRQGNIRHTYFDVPGKGSGRTDFSNQDETSRSESQPSSDSSQTFVKSVVSSSSQTRKTPDESKEITLPKMIQSAVTEGPSLTTGNQSTELQRTPTSLEKRPNIKGKNVVHGKQGKFNDTLPKMIHSLVNEGPPLITGNQSTPTSPEEQHNVNGKNVAHVKQGKFNDGDNKTKQLNGSTNLNGLSTEDDNQIGTSASGSVPPGNLPTETLFDGLTTITGYGRIEDGNRTGKTKQKPMATVRPCVNTNENHQLQMLWEQPVSANLNLEPDEADLISRTHGNQGLDGSEGNGLAEEAATFIARSAQGNLESRELQYGNPEVSPVTENGHAVVSPEESGQFTDRS